MRKLLPLLLLFTLACSVFTPLPTPTFNPTPGPEPSLVLPSPFPVNTLAPTLPPATATPVSTLSPSTSATPAGAFHLSARDVTFHPDPQLYSGDIVSLELDAANTDPAWREATVQVYVGSQSTEPIATTKFAPFGIGGRAQATFFWVWDTAGLVGPQTLLITVGEPEPLEVLTLTVNLLPADTRPAPEHLAQWTQSESECCIFHYLTHTAAARDIALITAQADQAFAEVEAALGEDFNAQVTFTLLSRLLGHGGFASDEISLTYIDRDPIASDLYSVFKHEGTHILDRQIAQERPTLLTEGLAVYVAGGHFKPEDLDQRAAALLALNRYLPLPDLAADFYPAQHEIGYLEGGALVKYLVDTFGWEKFRTFYASFQSAPTDAAMLDAALRANFNLSLAEAEAQWLAQLRALPPNAAQVSDLRLSIALYDTVRRYQQQNDPSAYFLAAWLPNGSEARRRNIIADFIRHPHAPENIALETMLAAAGQGIIAQEFESAEALINAVNAVLEANNLFFDPLAIQYLQIVTDLSATGYEAQHITLTGDTATVSAIRQWPTLESLTLTHGVSGWQMSTSHHTLHIANAQFAMPNFGWADVDWTKR